MSMNKDIILYHEHVEAFVDLPYLKLYDELRFI